jgi:hypothetical protein
MVIANIWGDEKVCVDIPPPFPQRIIVPENATKQKGHLGNKARRIPESRPICFLPAERFSFFPHGLQTSLDVETVIIKHMAAISRRQKQPGKTKCRKAGFNSGYSI